ncbi:MAG TPA: SMI1/KNR4 family protein [Pseudoxanthomonas sp.]|nr:SMI1/KNR4 family protein [Pseudoxanthomonas sp.]
MEYIFIKDIVDLLNTVDDFYRRDFRECSETEIETLEKLLPEYVYLPESYEEFLRFGGHGICDMLRGTDFYFSQIYALRKERTPQILKDMGFSPENFDKSYLREELFIFYYRQGYFGRFFYLEGGSDPSIFYYESGLPHDFLITQEQSFSQYLYAEVENFVEQYRKNIAEVDTELRSRVKRYRHGLMNTLDVLASIPAHISAKSIRRRTGDIPKYFVRRFA